MDRSSKLLLENKILFEGSSKEEFLSYVAYPYNFTVSDVYTSRSHHLNPQSFRLTRVLKRADFAQIVFSAHLNGRVRNIFD